MSLMKYSILSFFFMSSLFLISLLNHKEEWTSKIFSSFECGFDPILNLRSGISKRFILFLIYFILFDLEIFVILPFYSVSKMTFSLFAIFFLMFFILFFYEGFTDILDWK